MPSRTVELAKLDTSVYIENFRTGHYTRTIADSPYLFRSISVFIHELLRGAKRPEEREFALDLANNLRLYTPTERIWQDSGDIVARLASAKNYEKRKIQELSFADLIALSAHSIGATVITLNQNDFEDIKRYRRFRLISWA
jgi:predicted nucleic acid-binding protein